MGSMAPIIPPLVSSIRWNTLHNHYDALVSSAAIGSGDKQGVGIGESPEDAFGYALADFCKQNGIKHSKDLGEMLDEQWRGNYRNQD